MSGRSGSPDLPGRARLALAALVGLGLITASWWALALWPLPSDAPAWLTRTRAVCFGALPDTLPDAGGWILLVGQPIGMLMILLTGGGKELRLGIQGLASRLGGRVALAGGVASVVLGLVGVVLRVDQARGEAFPLNPGNPAELAAMGRIDDKAAGLRLTDQHGNIVDLAQYADRSVIVTFAFAHCTAVCPTIVHDQLQVLEQSPPGWRPALLIVTLDPWRDTPERLASMAAAWGLDAEDTHVLSGPVDEVEAVLSRWRIPRTRNTVTGDVAHPTIVYLVRPGGRLAYALDGTPDVMLAALKGL
ncbi:MAG: SCO family protein [Gemmatimonadota bacterium]